MAHPFFRWVPSDCIRLTFNEYELRDGRKQLRVIQPDAVLELPGQRRRFFLECEMGGHTISPGPSRPPGATLSKAERYQEYFIGFADSHAHRTHYAAQYPDGFAAEVLFLVRTAGRAASVNAALASWRDKVRGLQTRCASFRAVTFGDAAAELRRSVGLPTIAAQLLPKAHGPEPSAKLAITREEALLLDRYLFESVNAIDRARAAFRELGRTDFPEYPRFHSSFRVLVERLTKALHSG